VSPAVADLHFQRTKECSRIHAAMKYACIFFVLCAQTLCAGLEKYSQLVVADAQSARPMPLRLGPVAPYHGVRVTYLGTNGFEFRVGNHALLVDPYFSRINLSRIALGSRIQPDIARIDDAMNHLVPKADAILVTHGHFVHLLDVPIVMQKTGARLLASSSAVDLARRAGAPSGDSVKAGD